MSVCFGAALGADREHLLATSSAAGRLDTTAGGCAGRRSSLSRTGGSSFSMNALLKRRHHRRSHPMGAGPGEPLGGSVAAAAGKALLGGRAAAGLVHAGKWPRAILAGEALLNLLLPSRRAGGDRGPARHRQGQSGRNQRVTEDHQPVRDPMHKPIAKHIAENSRPRGGVQITCGRQPDAGPAASQCIWWPDTAAATIN